MLKFPELQQQLQGIIGVQSATRNFKDLLEYAQLISDLHIWCKSSLSNSHLVDVAAALNKHFNISLEEMAMLDIPTDVLVDFPNWKEASTADFSPKKLDIQLPDFGVNHPLKLLRLQLSPFSPTLSTVILLIRRLLERLDESVHFHISLEPGGDTQAMFNLISEFHPSAANRISLFEVQTASIFAQDNARGARKSDGEPLILLPRGFRQERERSRDALEKQVVGSFGGISVYRSRLYWEGGNIINDDRNCFIGSDHITENMNRIGLSAEEVKVLFRSEFGENTIFLGDLSSTLTAYEDLRTFASGQASFHIDLDVALLGKAGDQSERIALLASPEKTLPYIDKVLSLEHLVSDHFLDDSNARELIKFEYQSYAEERIPHLRKYRSELINQGYRIIDVPDLRIDPQDNLFSTRNLDFIYCNLLSGTVSGNASILYLPYGIPVLDELAVKAYQESGCHVIPLGEGGRLANMLMLFRGGLRCACSQIQ